MDLPFAEDVNYWKTGRSSPDVWLEKARKQIEKVGGTVLLEGYGNELSTGRAAYMLTFAISGDRFKVVWPVLPSRAGNERAARIQAATMLYHDVKARCVTALVLGPRSAFFSYLQLNDGRSVSEIAQADLPRILLLTAEEQI